MDFAGAQLRPLDGGFSGETFMAEVAGERSVVRIYAGATRTRPAEAPEIDAAVLRLVRGLLPVPEVLEVRRADPDAGTPGVLVTTPLSGTRLDLVLPSAGPTLQAAIGAELGALLARLAQMPMLHAGLFLDSDLRLGRLPDGATDLVEWLAVRLPGTALESWSSDDRTALTRVLERAQTLLDTVDRCCLVHSDLNPKNLIVDPGTGALTGLVDWEFAHAGSPFTDLGNLLRFDRGPGFVRSVASAYVAGVSPPWSGRRLRPEEALELARATDLWALIDLAARRGENPVAEQAFEVLLAIARADDVQATAG